MHKTSKSAINYERIEVMFSYLFLEDGLGLTTVSLLFAVVTSPTLGSVPFLGLFVLRHLVGLVAFAFFAVSPALFGYVHLKFTTVSIEI